MSQKKQIRAIEKRYDEQLDFLKQNYLKDTGLKIARGFKDTEEYKKNRRNKKQAVYRFVNKDRLAERRRQKKKDLEELTEKLEKVDKDKGRGLKGIFQDDLENIEYHAINEPFHTVLSYGNTADTAAVLFFKLNKRILGDKVFAVVDGTEVGHKKNSYTSLYFYQNAIRDLFQHCSSIQAKKRGSNYVYVSVMEGTTKDGRTVLLVYATLEMV